MSIPTSITHLGQLTFGLPSSGKRMGIPSMKLA
jgi:hypothetical protein